MLDSVGNVCRLGYAMPHANAVHVDGEPMQMDGVLDIEMHPGQLNIICPEHPTSSVLEPVRYAFEDIHYMIQGNLKKGVKQFNDFNRPVIEKAESLLNPLFRRKSQAPNPDEDDEPMQEP